MTQLTTDFATHVIVYYDKGYDMITSQEYEYVLQISATQKGCKLKNGNYIAFSAIARIIDIDQFYREHPDENTQNTNYTYNHFQDYDDKAGNQQIRQPTPEAAKKMKQGFIGYHLSKGRTQEESEKRWSEFRLLSPSN